MRFTVVNTLALGLLSALVVPVTSFWRLPCKVPIVTERADPVISPGKVASHVHTIMGGNGFGFTMDYAQARASTCSSCTVTKDMSNYWVPTLYFKAKNGSFISVNQAGGATIYYEQRVGHTGEQLLAFPEGFRMVAGNPSARSYTGAIDAQAITYACLNYNGPATKETPGFPTTNCPSGLRAQVYFPSCWDGVNLDSPDHKSHVHYPTSYNNGACPPSHPKHLISLFYEVIWNVNDFANEWYGDTQPFVWSMGDPTGYGYHGDFVNGWDVPTLQKAVDTCNAESGRVEDCSVFNLISDGQAEGCRIPPSINENVFGVLDALPGCNPVQAGPGNAVPKTDCGAPSTIGTPETYFTDLTVSKKWEYAGCGTDSITARVLVGDHESNDKMTIETCVDYCSGKGFSVAGLEFARECYCGNEIGKTGAPVPGVMGNCMMKCVGDSGEYCGGYAAISLYQKCGSTCQNVKFGVVGNSTTPASTDSSAPAAPIKAPGNALVSSSESASATTASTQATSDSTALANNPVVTSKATPESPIATATDAYDSTPPAGASEVPSATSPGVSASSTVPGVGATAVPTAESNVTLPSGWRSAGCFSDALNPRSLSFWAYWGEDITSSGCAKYCDSKGYTFAGTENKGQCFCGNELIKAESKPSTDCNLSCRGSDAEICGGSARLSVFTKSSAKPKRSHRHGRVHYLGLTS